MEVSIQEKVFNKAFNMRLPVHTFGNKKCMFYKGYKFEKEELDGGLKIFRAYNIRPLHYKDLTNEEIDIILRFGIIMASDLMSYGLYNGIISRYTKLLTSSRMGYKMIEKTHKTIEFYRDKCKKILIIHNKNKEIFV
jgi:hypothetical protein